MQLLSTLGDSVSILNSRSESSGRSDGLFLLIYFPAGGKITIGLINEIEIATSRRRWQLKIKVRLNLEKSPGSRFTCRIWISQIQTAETLSVLVLFFSPDWLYVLRNTQTMRSTRLGLREILHSGAYCDFQKYLTYSDITVIWCLFISEHLTQNHLHLQYQNTFKTKSLISPQI